MTTMKSRALKHLNAAMVCGALVLQTLAGCHPPAAHETAASAPERPEVSTQPSNPGEELLAVATKAGVISPRIASCPAHCQHVWNERAVQAEAPPDAAAMFEGACFRSCVAQVIERSGRQCYGLFGPPFGEAQALYLDRHTVENAVPCMHESGDSSPGATRLWQLFEQEQRTPVTQAAFAKELTAIRTATDHDYLAAKEARGAANASAEWQAVLQAFAVWQAGDTATPALLECMERIGTHCAVASGDGQ